jgi:hypothetical protein
MVELTDSVFLIGASHRWVRTKKYSLIAWTRFVCRYGPVAGCCVHGNEPTGSVRGVELMKFQVLKAMIMKITTSVCIVYWDIARCIR